MTHFARERVHGLWPELMPLLEAHWSEVAYHGYPLRVNRAAYEALEDAGSLRVYTMRVNGELVGYAVYVKHPSIRHEFVQAHQDGIYVKPEYRGGAGLAAWATARLRDEGIKWVQWGSPFERVGPKLVGRIYAKEL
jgi:hypothetical protein